MKNMLKRFVQDEQGLELSEYAVMAALIVAALITVIIALRGAIGNKFSSLANTINTQS
jgi:Flp pilus assembly pilin Flp